MALVHQIEQTSRRRHQDIGFFTQRAYLRADRHAAEDHRARQRQVVSIVAETLVDLQCKFARRRQDQRADLTAALLTVEHLQHRQRKSRRLAGARLGGSQQIFAGQYLGNSLFLNRRRLFIPFFS